MTKKDYVKFAEIIKSAYGLEALIDEGKNPDCASIAFYIRTQLIDLFEADNPRFNREKFLKACEIEEKP